MQNRPGEAWFFKEFHKVQLYFTKTPINCKVYLHFGHINMIIPLTLRQKLKYRRYTQHGAKSGNYGIYKPANTWISSGRITFLS